MTTRLRFLPVAVCAAILSCVPSLAQTPERRQTNPTPQSQEQSPTLPPNAGPTDVVANEIGLLRKSLQTLNARLREISEKVLATDAGKVGAADAKQSRIALQIELLSRVEQRAEVLRKQLLELIEKETLLRGRLVQIEEDLRPESIERAVSLVGTTRTTEMRDVRRRVLDNDRRGFESLLNQTAQSRVRLEEDVRNADSMVSKLRQRILPLIDKEIEKINPN